MTSISFCLSPILAEAKPQDMKDREILESLGQLLFEQAPTQKDELNLSVYLNEHTINFTMWSGRKANSGTGFTLTDKGNRELETLVRELNQYFKENNMGQWNTVLYTLNPIESKFEVNFESVKELDTGELKLWRYRKKYQ